MTENLLLQNCTIVTKVIVLHDSINMTLRQLLSDYIKEGEMGRLCCMHGEMIKAYRILHGKPEERRP
jgi:hypothetical protein